MKKSDIWAEGKYVDLWSVNHFLSGVFFSGWVLMLGLSMWMVFLLYLAVAIGWELFESWKGINEHFENKVLDVAIGALGVLLVYLLIAIGKPLSLMGLIIVTIAYAGLEVHGYMTYTKRKVLGDRIN